VRAYVRYAYRQARFRIGCIPIVVGFVAFVLWVPLVSFISTMISPQFASANAADALAIATLVSIVAVPFIIGFHVRDRVLLRILHDRLKTARCPQCAFSLLGLPIAAGIARCPECGFNVELHKHNLTPEDLQIRRVGEGGAAETEYTNCRKCSFNVRGITITKNSVRCPECGHVEVLHKLAVVNSLYGGRTPEAFVSEHSRIIACPTCSASLLGLPIFEGQARCECGFIANVTPRPGDNLPVAESASEIGLRVKRGKATPPDADVPADP
jgi:DNA-directed RNA polymerase subunit RPC12/RpoP